MRIIAIWAALLLLNILCVSAQQPPQDTVERQVPLTERAVALDIKGMPALEATLRTSALNGASDTPVTNIRLVVKNIGPLAYSYVSGVVTFYDGSQVRCGEGMFKADSLFANESFETDTPGIRITCSPASWRIVGTNLLPRTPPGLTGEGMMAQPANLIISVDGEEHPIQLDKPMVLNVGDKQRTIIVRQSP